MQSRVPWWLRLFLLVGGLETLVYGAEGFFAPFRGLPGLRRPLFITPFGARFIGALYLVLAVSFILAAFAHTPADTRIPIASFGIAAGLILLVMLLHWQDFRLDRLRFISAGAYGLNLLLSLAVWLWLRRHTGPLPPPRQPPSLFQLEGLLLGIVGLMLLLVPDYGIRIWPWRIMEVLAQLYACFFIAFATGAALAAREAYSPAGRIFSTTSLCLSLLALAASVQHLDRFKAGPSIWLWFSIVGLGVIAFTLDLLQRGTDRSGGSSDISQQTSAGERPSENRVPS